MSKPGYCPPVKFPNPWDPQEVYLFRMIPFEVAKELFQHPEQVLGTDSFCPLKSYTTHALAKPNIEAKRKNRSIPADPGGVLSDYVSFYFAPRSSMLYSLYKKQSGGTGYDAARVIYLVTQVKYVVAAERPFIFSDVHALLEYARFSSDLNQLHEFLNLQILQAQYFNSSKNGRKDQDARQAEFLVYQCLPLDAIWWIVVCSRDIHDSLTKDLPVKWKNKTKVRPKWYF